MSIEAGIAPSPPLASNIAKELQTCGYSVIRGAASPELIRSIERDLAPAFETAPFCRGGFYGERTKRFGRLLLRSALTERLVLHAEILAAAEEILRPWCDTIQLNLTQGLSLHPGALQQFPHRDQDMWQGVKGEVEYLVNVMWPFTPYERANGATLIWPGSHGAAALAAETGDHPLAIELAPGDALVFLGSTLHGAGANRSTTTRRGMIVSYCLGWLKPYENQWLAYPPAIARRFGSELAALVGYRQHRPNLGNYEGLCPSVLLGPHPPSLPGATDALRGEQSDALNSWMASQHAARGSGQEGVS
ncbi:ectoine hydroxylase-related dioxygenase (phytanoyl-CoA dioxygenase family) [Novosphingobium sp. PhB55]|uniref:phytanoyl-CoA dioxygenase family protein n=1 Tax=Novosphingobium sp. PhB55 TaxID=2485106 RepID=UPI001066D633|nr:phytanoyl-CoA dioxygenase family protein [Novosphingobium sp. PhB55]TDW61561.1 ectoine hydroxylase-related dioxygenase (phytanoyl-CoA dioxygenase family) [Novosphingobium sp. PhB55]